MGNASREEGIRPGPAPASMVAAGERSKEAAPINISNKRNGLEKFAQDHAAKIWTILTAGVVVTVGYVMTHDPSTQPPPEKKAAPALAKSDELAFFVDPTSPPKEIWDKLQKAEELFNANKFQEALDACSEILLLEKNFPDALELKGDAWIKLGQPEKAFACYKGASLFALAKGQKWEDNRSHPQRERFAWVWSEKSKRLEGKCFKLENP